MCRTKGAKNKNPIKPRSHGHWMGGKASPTYRSWNNMLTRCTCESHREFKHYGGSGVTVCERWKTFENFLQDMGERPEGTTLGRKLDSGNYEPGNAYWQTPAQQAQERANRRMI